MIEKEWDITLHFVDKGDEGMRVRFDAPDCITRGQAVEVTREVIKVLTRYGYFRVVSRTPTIEEDGQ